MPNKTEIEQTIKDNPVVVYSKTSCPFCIMAKKALGDLNIKYKLIELDRCKDMAETQAILSRMTGARTVPRVFVNGKCIGGGTETKEMAKNGKLMKLLESSKM